MLIMPILEKLLMKFKNNLINQWLKKNVKYLVTYKKERI